MTHLEWQELDRRMDEVAEGDKAGIVAVFLEYEGQALTERDGRGARKTINISTFCAHFRLGRGTFSRWLAAYGKEQIA